MTARRDGDHYVINGTKTWITNGAEGSCFAMLVKTDPDAKPRYNGMSLFITPKMKGFTVGRKLPKLGYKAIDTAELIFEDYRVPADHLIGGVEGQGFFQTTGGLELGRINVASRGVGIAEGALKLASEYAQIRKTFGKPICEHQAIQLKLGEMATRARAARLLTLDAARAFDDGERCDMEAGMAKYFASEAALENSIEGMRIHGAYGYSAEYDIERLYRDAPLTCIGEGTNEMQRIIISKQHDQKESRTMKPLQGVRIVSVEQFGAGPYAHHAACRPRRRGHQGREPRDRRRSIAQDRPVHAGRQRQRVLPGLQHQQEERLPRPAAPMRARRRCTDWSATRGRPAQQPRGDLPAKLGLDYKSMSAVNAKHRLRARFGLRPRTTSAPRGPATTI